MKNAVFWVVGSCRSCVSRRFGVTYRLHVQGRKISERGPSVQSAATCSPWFLASEFFTLKVEAIHSSGTSVYTIYTRRYITLFGLQSVSIFIGITVCIVGIIKHLQIKHQKQREDLNLCFSREHRFFYVYSLQIFIIMWSWGLFITDFLCFVRFVLKSFDRNKR
jgi:hypothetical protein